MITSFVYPSSAQYTGGVVALYEFANALARRGHDVHFLHGPASPHRIDRIEELDWFAFEPGVRHHLVDSFDDPSLPRADVIFAPSFPAHLGLPAVFVQGHGMMNPEWEREAFRARCPKICIAGWLTDVGVEYGSPPEQLVHVSHGMDQDLFRIVTPLDERPVDVAVLYNKHPAKAWDVALKSLEIVREQRPDLRVQVFGILPPEMPIPDWMPFERGLDREHLVTGIYNRAKVFLQPSWYEGFGFTAVEAMASGCALVTTDNGGSRDYAIEGETALISPPGDVSGLAAQVEELLGDDRRRIELATAGAAYVSRFTWDRAGEELERHLLAYVADPARFQGPPGPDRSATPQAIVGPPAPSRSVTNRPPGGLVESDIVFNVVWTGTVFTSLKYFVASQVAQSQARFRFVANGCPPDQLRQMEEFRERHPDRVLEVMDVSETMVAHGVALDTVRSRRDDGPCFSLIDPDIKANAPFMAAFLDLLVDNQAVTSGKEVWTDDNLVPVDHPGVAGEHFFDRKGFVFGSPHLAIYDRAALDETTARWGIGLGSAGPELRDDAKARLVAMGHGYTVYDTGKIVNALLQADGNHLVHRDLDQLVHIGGLSHFVSPAFYLKNDAGEDVPEWTRWETMGTRHAVTRFTAGTLDALAAGQPPPPLPVGLDAVMEARLLRVRSEVVDLVERYGDC